jgi:hypothetical protein
MTYSQKQAELAKMSDQELRAVVRVADCSLHTITTDPGHWRDLKDIAQWLLKWRVA